MTVYLFTNTYPYGKLSETFLETEIFVAGVLNVDVVIIPLNKLDICREVVSNIKVDSGLVRMEWIKKGMILLKMLCSRWLWKLFFQKNNPKNLFEFYQGIKYLYGAFLIRDFVLYNKKKFKKNGIFYSYWFNHTPLGLAWAMQDDYFKNYKLYTRAHGFDVYEREVGVFIPYREEALKRLKKVWVVSRYGAEYLKQKYPIFQEKIQVAHLGVSANIPKEDKIIKADISFLSCSSVIPVKRVTLIYEMINYFCKMNPQKKVCWTHIGGGDGYNDLQKIVLNKVFNMEIVLLGEVDNKTVKEIYQNNKFDVFVNLSSSEGIPVSIMEAISFGIPVVATNVGGNAEIVNVETGKLISAEVETKEFVQAVLWIMENHAELEISTMQFYKNEFNAEKNYKFFYSQLLS